MTRTLLALTLVLSACASKAQVDPYVQRVTDLAAKHRASLDRLNGPAALTAQALLAGNALYLTGNDSPWLYEAAGRAGGLMKIDLLPAPDLIRKGDAVWMSYSPKNYQDAVQTASSLEQKGCVVIAFGPQPASGAAKFTNWIDSFTPPDTDDNFTLMGNVLSLWSLTAEVASSTARQSKTVVFWQSGFVPGAPARNGHYQNLTFHDGLPQMAPVNAGLLASSYLDYVSAMLGRIASTQLPAIQAAGKQIAQQASNGTPATLVAVSHLVAPVASGGSQLFTYLNDPTQLSLPSGGLLIYLGYSGVDLEIWRTVRRSGAKAIWVVSPLPGETDFTYFGDTVIDEQWQFGDGAVSVPGYDTRILPPSGIAQLFIYELLQRAAVQP